MLLGLILDLDRIYGFGLDSVSLLLLDDMNYSSSSTADWILYFLLSCGCIFGTCIVVILLLIGYFILRLHHWILFSLILRLCSTLDSPISFWFSWIRDSIFRFVGGSWYVLQFWICLEVLDLFGFMTRVLDRLDALVFCVTGLDSGSRGILFSFGKLLIHHSEFDGEF